MATEKVNKPPSLPPYPEMIMSAINALGEEGGSSKTAISKYIESQYEDLPAGHSTLLAHHLSKMKDNGDLVFAKNNYMRPDPNAPPKRGRGRPPKPKEPLPPGTVVSPPRPRGRPPKPKDPLAVAAAKASSGMPKRRGRPPKKSSSQAAVVGAPGTVTLGVKRGRGRPPKVKPAVTVGGSD